MDNIEGNLPAAKRRFWYQSIAGKLISAFILVAGLTVAATLVAIVQFGNIDNVLTRLTELSLAAVKYSLAVESNAKAIAAGSAQLAAATSEVQRFRRMSELTEQIGNLWSNLSHLRAVIGDTAKTTRLQSLIASIDERVGQLDRAVRERIALVAARDRASNHIPDSAEALGGALALEVLQATPRSGTNDAQILATIYEIRADIAAAAALLYQVPAVDKADAVVRLQKSFDGVRERLLGGQAKLAAMGLGSDPALQKLIQAAQELTTLGSGKTGLFQIRVDELAQQTVASDLQLSLEQVVSEMETQVKALVLDAEQEAVESKALSANALANSRFWLLVIASVSLMAAVLVVWLIVIRYIVARLRELTRGMVAVAEGALDTRIPKFTPDEIGDMSRALTVFRNNAREIRIAKDEAEEARLLAEAASRTKSAFLANMSHELRTPLNAIIGYSEILHEDAADRNDTASQADLVKIQSAGKHLLGLINDILDLSKIEVRAHGHSFGGCGSRKTCFGSARPCRSDDEQERQRLSARYAGRYPHDACRRCEAQAEPRQSSQQCREIHQAGNGEAFGSARRRRQRDGGGDIRRQRFRNWYDARADEPFVPGLHTSGRDDDPKLWRHRPRTNHHQAFLHHDGRLDRCDEQAGRGLDLHDHAAGRWSARSRPPIGGSAARRAERSPAKLYSLSTTIRLSMTCYG